MAREETEKKLETALAAFKPMTNDKSFKSLIKKAGKLFSHGIKKQHEPKPAKVAVEKKGPVTVKEVKKVAKKVAKKAVKKSPKGK